MIITKKDNNGANNKLGFTISNPCGCYVCDSCRNIENDKREIMINDTTNDTTDNDTINDNVIHHRLKNIKQWVYNNIINQLFE